MTHLSLASSLTMDYLPPSAPYDPAAMDRTIQDARFIHELRGRGYQYVFLETSWFGTDEAALADVSIRRGSTASQFESLFLRTTVAGQFLPPPARHEEVLTAFERLATLSLDPKPAFVFAHLLVPHPPLMFNVDGSVRPYVDDQGEPYEIQAYAEQVQFVNAQLLTVIDRIMEDAARESIIILQADHGPALLVENQASDLAEVYRERLAIFVAVHGPAELQRELYDSITPVNLFRVLSRSVFGADLPNLPDRSYFNWYNAAASRAVSDDPLHLRDVTTELRCGEC